MGEENHEKFHYVRFLLLLLLMMLFLTGSVSEVYTVGDEGEWDSQVDYSSWSQKYNFAAGDVLVFKYVKEQHNVCKVLEETYLSCNASTGVVAEYKSGNDQVKLDEAKQYWFICSVDEHCLGGMRFTIDVKAANVTSNVNSTEGTTAFAPQLQPPPPTNSCASYTFERLSFVIYLITLSTLLNLLV